MDNFWVAVSNFIVRHFVSKEVSLKYDLIIRQGLYHAETGTGPFIVNRKDS